MKTPSALLSVLYLTAFSLLQAHAETVFQDNFENPAMNPAWVVSATNDGRVVVTSDFSPATGNGHMVMDDGVTDTMFSSSEATLNLNMRNKKSAVLTFKAKSLGDEPHAPPTNGSTLRLFDSVSVSTNGGLSWRNAQSLAGLSETWQTFTVDLDVAVAATGGRYDTNFLLRFSQYDNAVAGIDGIAIDDVVLNAEPDQRVLIELPSSVTEGSVGNVGHLVLSIPPAAQTTVTLASTPVGQLVFPANIKIPAGETVVMFKFKANDDSLLNLSRTVTVTPSMTGATPFGATVLVLDNEEQPQMSLTLPAEVTEGLAATNNATVSLSMPAVVDATVPLATSPVGQLSVPATVKIPAGQTSAVFTVQATNDTVLDGDVPVAVTATLPGGGITNGTVTAVDNELPALDLVLPPAVTEGQATTGTVTVSVARASDLLVNITSASTAALGVTAQVTIPAGQTSATFAITAVNNTLVDLSRAVSVSVSGTGVSGGSRSITVLDDEPAPVMTLFIPPTLNEGDAPTENARLTLSSATDAATTVTIFGSPFGELNLPATVVIPAGHTMVNFTAHAVNDTKIDGNVLANISASAPGLVAVTASTLTVDNEPRTIALTLPTVILEGNSASGTVRISGTLPSNLVVALAGNNNSALSVPSTVMISAGATSATFNLAALDNTARDGSRKVTISARETTFTAASSTLEVRDNELASYQITGLTDIVNISAGVPATIAALDVERNVIPGHIGNVSVMVVLPDGSTQALTPATVPVSGTTGWSGLLTLPPTTAYPLKLRATDIAGYTGESLPFETLRMLPIPASDLVWDASRSRIYASVSAAAGGTYANQIVAIDPATAQVTGTTVSDQDPAKMALTVGGNFLYVAQDRNGTVAKIDPSTMNVISSFSVGGSENPEQLYAWDLCTVSGKPNLVVVLRYSGSMFPEEKGVAVYDNGLIRQNISNIDINSIEPSLDPNFFIGYSGNAGFTKLQLTSTGMKNSIFTQAPLPFSDYKIGMRSEGDIVFSGIGVQVDGIQQIRLGSFDITGFSPACPDSNNRQVLYLEPHVVKDYHDKIGAYDTLTMKRIQSLTLPAEIDKPQYIRESRNHTFIRWGANGLAFIHESGLAIINSKRLIPSDPPADLRVTIGSSPDSVTTGSPFEYTITVSNDGPNAARNVKASITFSDDQQLGAASASAGTFVISGHSGSLAIPELASGASATFTIHSSTSYAGSLTCVASALSEATDPLRENSTATKTVVVGFNTVVDSVNALRLDANNLVYDATRSLLWATIPSHVEAPLGNSIVSVNPTTGLVSAPIALGAKPFPGSIAISANGRYLFVGLSDSQQVARVDLQQSPPTVAIIDLDDSTYAFNYASDIEVLTGDGTSFIMVGNDSAASVYDGSERRPVRTTSQILNQVVPTLSANNFIGYKQNGIESQLVRLSLGDDGVSVVQTVGDTINLGYDSFICSAGNTILSSNGQLVNSANFERIALLPTTGIPVMDENYKSAYLLNGSKLSSFRMSDGVSQGSFIFTDTPEYEWAKILVRWGTDGFAATGHDGKIYFARWSGTKPANLDFDNDNIADAWEETHFRSLSASPSEDLDGDGIPNALEWFFASSPARSSGMPITTSVTGVGSSRQLVMFFPRRADIPASAYRYQFSSDLATWVSIPGYSESILSTSVNDGVSVNHVRVAIPFPDSDRGMVRIAWLTQ